MSWFSRSGSGGWGGRFSPFGRSNAAADGQVNNGDFSYITDEDIAAHRGGGRDRSSSRGAAKPEIVDWDDRTPNRDTDVVIFKHGRVSYPTHFPVRSIEDGSLNIGSVRHAAAKKLNVADPGRIRMFHKGRNLKFDDHTAREEGLRGDGNGSEILCVVGEASSGGMAPGADQAWSAGEDEEADTDDVSDSGPGGTATKKKSRKRGGKKSRKGRKAGNASETPPQGYSGAAATGSEFLPIPSHIPPPRPTSGASSSAAPSQSATPQTAIQKLDAIASKFHTEFVPSCVAFAANPPSDPSKRDFEHKKLSETILAQILLKLDGVETEGDPEARARRKELVKEVQGMLNKLDEVVK